MLDDGEYDDKPYIDSWSKEITPVKGTHTRGPSASSYSNTISSTETGTVRGRTSYVEQDEPNEDADLTVYGLGLTNLHEVQQEYSQDFGAAPPEDDPATLRTRTRPTPLRIAESPRDSPSTPFIFPPRTPRSSRSRPTSNNHQHHRSASRASSYAQEVEVASSGLHPYSEINLDTPNASSLLRNRRKATVSEWAGQVDSTEPVPQFDIPGSPTITLKSLGRNSRPVDETGMLISSPSPQLLETPPIDYDLESPSKARQRFHRAYKLVTDELRSRITHLRKSPITPDPPTRDDSAVSQNPMPEPFMRTSVEKEDRMDNQIQPRVTSPVEDAREPQENDAGPRSWLKPFRLVSRSHCEIYTANCFSVDTRYSWPAIESIPTK